MASVRKNLNDANPNILPTAMQAASVGDQIWAGPKVVTGAVATNALPLGFPALNILYAYSISGTVTGQMTPMLENATLATLQVKLSPDGQSVLFFATDAVTSAVVCVTAAEGNFMTVEVPVISNVATLPSAMAGLRLISATGLTGTAPGLKTTIQRASAPSAGQASLNLAGTGITFNGTDAITRASITFLPLPGVGAAPRSLAQKLSDEMSGY